MNRNRIDYLEDSFIRLSMWTNWDLYWILLTCNGRHVLCSTVVLFFFLSFDHYYFLLHDYLVIRLLLISIMSRQIIVGHRLFLCHLKKMVVCSEYIILVCYGRHVLYCHGRHYLLKISSHRNLLLLLFSIISISIVSKPSDKFTLSVNFPFFIMEIIKIMNYF